MTSFLMILLLEWAVQLIFAKALNKRLIEINKALAAG